MSRRLSVIFGLAILSLNGCSRAVPEYPVEAFYGTTEYLGGASISPDNTSLLVSSNATGVYNAVALPIAGGAPEALTFSTTDAVRVLGYFPQDGRILFSSDSAGDEKSHIYVRLVAGGLIRDLTPGSNLTATFLGWSGDDTTFFIATNERDPRYFDLYAYRTEDYSREMIYENRAGYELGPVSRDMRYLALHAPHSASDQDIYLHDRTSGTTTLLTPHDGEIRYAAQAFTPDGMGLLLTSDEGREFASLWRHDLASGAKTELLTPEWDVTDARYSHSGKFLIVSLNEDATEGARLYDAVTMSPVAIAGLPVGQVRDFTISWDDSHFAFSHSDGSAPRDYWVGQFGQQPTRLTDALGKDLARRDLVKPTIARFAASDGLEIPGLLYRPHGATKSTPAPALVMIHGGPGGQAQVGYSALTQTLVNHGYVVYAINNRGSSGYGKSFFQADDRRHGEADLQDVVEAKQMLIQTGYVDSTQIGVIGGSYGGYLVLAALAFEPNVFKVGVDLFGISNWSRTLTSIPPYWESMRSALYREMGDPVEDSARLRRISPLFRATSIRSPLLVLQGANDPRVLKVESDEIVAAVAENGYVADYIIFYNEGHGFLKKANEIKGTTAILAFLKRYLRGIEPVDP